MALPTRKVINPDGTESEQPKPLELSVDAEEMTLDESALFEERGFSVSALIEFLEKYSNWTRAEIGAMKIREFKEIALKMREEMTNAAIPKTNSPS